MRVDKYLKWLLFGKSWPNSLNTPGATFIAFLALISLCATPSEGSASGIGIHRYRYKVEFGKENALCQSLANFYNQRLSRALANLKSHKNSYPPSQTNFEIQDEKQFEKAGFMKPISYRTDEGDSVYETDLFGTGPVLVKLHDETRGLFIVSTDIAVISDNARVRAMKNISKGTFFDVIGHLDESDIRFDSSNIYEQFKKYLEVELAGYVLVHWPNFKGVVADFARDHRNFTPSIEQGSTRIFEWHGQTIFLLDQYVVLPPENPQNNLIVVYTLGPSTKSRDQCYLSLTSSN